MPRLRLVLLALVASLTLPALAQSISIRLTAGQLREKGINTFSFRPVCFTSNGLTLLGQDKAPAEERAQGKVNRIWLLEFGVEGKVRDIHPLFLDIPSVEALALTPDDRTAVVAGQAGATFLRLPLDGSPVSVLMEHKHGEPGFRGNPSYLRPIPGDILTMGYFYDQEDYAGDTLLATLNASQQGRAAFTGGADIQKAQKSVPGFYASNYTGPSSGFMAAHDGPQYQLYWWDGGNPRKIDEGDKLGSFWATGQRVCYVVYRTTGCQAMFYDAATDKQVVLGPKGSYSYPFLSDDGSTAVVCQLDLTQAKMDVYYARESDNWQLKPVTGLQKVKMGAIRLSPNGRFMVFYNGDFLHFTELP